jgi:hypothetical protein
VSLRTIPERPKSRTRRAREQKEKSGTTSTDGKARIVYASSVEQAGTGISFFGGFMDDNTQTQDQTGGSGDTPIVNTDAKAEQTQTTETPASDQ